jgi:hypothetical protein
MGAAGSGDYVFLCATSDAELDDAGGQACARHRAGDRTPVSFTLENGQVDTHLAEDTVSREQALAVISAWAHGTVHRTGVDWVN